ncbi:type II secretion system protein N [Yersinia hibernica]|uniref:type II secretion system protein N n=1 Tax=Yersinia hibernica TaxID=2339259 RepID=UPI001FE40C73|nr:type II secretion system protein N [Yersinia hibernica]
MAILLLIILIVLRIEQHLMPLWLASTNEKGDTLVVTAHENSAKKYEKVELNRLNLFSAAEGNSRVNPYRVGYLTVDDPLLLQAPRSNLAVNLVGVLSSSLHEKSIAIIEQNKRQNSYVQGEKLPENQAVVIKIFDDRVIINRQGYYEALLLDSH